MGSTLSRNKARRAHQGIQTSPVILESSSTRRRSLSIPSRSHDPLFVRTPRQTRSRPVSVHGDLFELETNMEEYSAIWDQDAKLSSVFQQLSRSNSRKLEHQQNETLNRQWSKVSTKTFDSARVESTIDSKTHSDIHLASSEKITDLINHLSQIHSQLDNKTKRRTSQISEETASLLLHILHETQEKQQRLLTYAKEQQQEHEKTYQKILQEYVSQLDELKAKELADLQKQLQSYRDELLEESQLKIMTVNDQANMIKTKILQDEQHQASTRIDSLVAQIQKLTADNKVQHFGSEVKTATNIITNISVGTKPNTLDFQRINTPGERLKLIGTTAQSKRDLRSSSTSATIRKLKQKD